MVAQFCMKCGQPLPAGAAFCLSCGTPVPPAVGGAPPPPPPPPPPGSAPSLPAPPPPTGPSLSVQLGIQGIQNFLLQHQMMAAGHSYRVLDHQKRHLFSARENFGAEAQANTTGGGLFGAMQAGMLGGGFQNRSLNRAFAWSIHDAQGNPRGAIAVQLQGSVATSTLSDAAGTPLFTCQINRGFTGMTATAVYPDGRPLLEAKGHLISHNFALHDASGAEVAKVHEAWASVRDTYNLDVSAKVDPLAPLIFAILIDREKEAGRN
ncbi:MAG TPA: zinc-ribbon domain-containing protein [Thermoplasmata archaeon]|nr:zinc-ribbon domain-containing protein [Thermoplasmata archaeon]